VAVVLLFCVADAQHTWDVGPGEAGNTEPSQSLDPWDPRHYDQATWHPSAAPKLHRTNTQKRAAKQFHAEVDKEEAASKQEEIASMLPLNQAEETAAHDSRKGMASRSSVLKMSETEVSPHPIPQSINQPESEHPVSKLLNGFSGGLPSLRRESMAESQPEKVETRAEDKVQVRKAKNRGESLNTMETKSVSEGLPPLPHTLNNLNGAATLNDLELAAASHQQLTKYDDLFSESPKDKSSEAWLPGNGKPAWLLHMHQDATTTPEISPASPRNKPKPRLEDAWSPVE